MKKKLFYLAVAALLAMNVALTSCSKDDEPAVPDSLSGTVWGISSGGNSLTLSFVTEILYEMSASGPGLDELSGMGFYTYSKPNLILKLSIGDDAEEIHGTVKGNKLTLIVEDFELVLTKK
ncbi:MAG: hypothetical protein LBK94_01745 [Prevotellaceae bacterium]|jgi:hypothetical protein|nr:hypothetical protein [Prevotellaceae bacterium]